MNVRSVMMVVMCGCAGGGGGSLDAGLDAGADAGMDGGCEPLPYVADLLYSLLGPLDALVEQPVAVTVSPAYRHLPPTRCLEVSATRGGTTAPVSIERIPLDEPGRERVTFTFVPPVTGRWTLTVKSINPAPWPEWSLWLDVVEKVPVATPCATVSRACDAGAVAADRLLCDDTMLDFSGTTVATLDGGLWFGEGASMFAWSDGWVSPATPSGAVLRDGGVPIDRPLHWFTDDRTLVIGTEGGVFIVDILSDRLGPPRRFGGDAGTPFAAAVWDAGVVVLAVGAVCTETRCRELPDFGLRFGLSYAFSRSQLVYDALTNLFTGQMVVTRLQGFDEGPARLPVDRRGLISSASDRRVIEASAQGLYVLDQAGQRLGMPMGIPPGFLRAGSSEAHVWVTSPGRTDVYCQ